MFHQLVLLPKKWKHEPDVQRVEARRFMKKEVWFAVMMDVRAELILMTSGGYFWLGCFLVFGSQHQSVFWRFRKAD